MELGCKALYVMCGAPGAGKSYYAQKWSHEYENDGFTTAIISRDAIRFSLLKEGEDYFAHETKVYNEFIRQINEAIELGINYVFVDQTSLTPGARKKLINRLILDPSTKVIFSIIHRPLDVCLKQNALREGLARVPDTQVKKMYKSFVEPTGEEVYGYNLPNTYDICYYF